MIRKIFIFIFIVGLGSVFLVNAQEQQSVGSAYNSKGKRDPLMPLVSPEGYIIAAVTTDEVSEFKLEGIAYGQGQDNYAVINSSIFRAGDIIGDYKVKEIGKEKVILTNDKEDIILELEKGEE